MLVWEEAALVSGGLLSEKKGTNALMSTDSAAVLSHQQGLHWLVFPMHVLMSSY